MKQFRQSQSGFSLIELMIASLLSLLMLTALIQIFLSIKTTYRLQHALATMQENGRYANYFLNQTIRMAGYARCADSKFPVLDENAIYGYVSEQTPDFLKHNRVRPETDIIVIQRCVKINNEEKIAKIAFYIADTLQQNQAEHPIYGLYEKIISNQSEIKTQEVVSGIENMQVTYGLSNEGDRIDAYKKATQMHPEDWQKVSSVQIALLMNSIENVLNKPKNYDFNNQQIISNDRKLYKEWDSYVALRELGYR